MKQRLLFFIVALVCSMNLWADGNPATITVDEADFVTIQGENSGKVKAGTVAPDTYMIMPNTQEVGDYKLYQVKKNGEVLASVSKGATYYIVELAAGDKLDITALYPSDTYKVTFSDPSAVKSAGTATQINASGVNGDAGYKFQYTLKDGYTADIASGFYLTEDTYITIKAPEAAKATVIIDNAQKVKFSSEAGELTVVDGTQQFSAGQYMIASTLTGYKLASVKINGEVKASVAGTAYWLVDLDADDKLEITADYEEESYGISFNDAAAIKSVTSKYNGGTELEIKTGGEGASSAAPAGYFVEVTLNEDYASESTLKFYATEDHEITTTKKPVEQLSVEDGYYMIVSAMDFQGSYVVTKYYTAEEAAAFNEERSEEIEGGKLDPVSEGDPYEQVITGSVTKAIYNNDGKAGWNTFDKKDSYLFKITKAAAPEYVFPGTDANNVYKVVNMQNGMTFGDIAKSSQVSYVNATDSCFAFDKIDGKTVTRDDNEYKPGKYQVVSIRNAGKDGESTNDLYCDGNAGGTGTSGNVVGRAKSEAASQWILIPIPNEEANEWLEPEPEPEPAGSGLFVVGTMNEWTVAQKAYEMTTVTEGFEFSFDFGDTELVGQNFKITDATLSDWSDATVNLGMGTNKLNPDNAIALYHGSTNNIAIADKYSSAKNVVITLKYVMGEWIMSATGNFVEGEKEIPALYLRGINDDWSATEDNKLTKAADKDEWTLTLDVTDGSEFKVADDHWGDYNFGGSDEADLVLGEPYTLYAASDVNLALPGEAAPGNYTFTLTKSEDNVWTLTVVNNDIPTGITNVNVTEAKNGKFIQNNRVVIVKNGKTYTPAGTSVK